MRPDIMGLLIRCSAGNANYLAKHLPKPYEFNNIVFLYKIYLTSKQKLKSRDVCACLLSLITIHKQKYAFTISSEPTEFANHGQKYINMQRNSCASEQPTTHTHTPGSNNELDFYFYLF